MSKTNVGNCRFYCYERVYYLRKTLEISIKMWQNGLFKSHEIYVQRYSAKTCKFIFLSLARGDLDRLQQIAIQLMAGKKRRDQY